MPPLLYCRRACGPRPADQRSTRLSGSLSTSNSDSPSALLVFRLFVGELSEVLLDDVPIVGWKFLANLLQGLLPLFGWQVAPARFVSDVLAGYIARPFSGHPHAIRRRA